jgi:hypothetical protein
VTVKAMGIKMKFCWWLCVQLEVLKKRSLLEDLSDDFSEIGLHDLWSEFAILETKAQDFEEGCWVYHASEKRTIGRSCRWRENVERMCFLDESWKCLKELKLADFVNVEAFRLQVHNLMEDRLLDLDLSGLKCLKSLVVRTPGLRVRINGLSSLANLCYLSSSTPGLSPYFDSIGHFTNLQFLLIFQCKGVKVLDLIEIIASNSNWRFSGLDYHKRLKFKDDQLAILGCMWLQVIARVPWFG